jgi:hypothetical protein
MASRCSIVVLNRIATALGSDISLLFMSEAIDKLMKATRLGIRPIYTALSHHHGLVRVGSKNLAEDR